MTDKEKLAIAIKTVEIYFNENISVKEAIKKAKRCLKKKVMN